MSPSRLFPSEFDPRARGDKAVILSAADWQLVAMVLAAGTYY